MCVCKYYIYKKKIHANSHYIKSTVVINSYTLTPYKNSTQELINTYLHYMKNIPGNKLYIHLHCVDPKLCIKVFNKIFNYCIYTSKLLELLVFSKI